MLRDRIDAEGMGNMQPACCKCGSAPCGGGGGGGGGLPMRYICDYRSCSACSTNDTQAWLWAPGAKEGGGGGVPLLHGKLVTYTVTRHAQLA